MADAIKIESMPDSGSREAVALALTRMVLHAMPGDYKVTHAKSSVLQTYAECLSVVNGNPYRA